MSVGRLKPLLATESGRDIQDFIDSDSLRKLGVLDRANLNVNIAILNELKLLNNYLTLILGEEADVSRR